MDIRQLQHFVAVVEECHFTRAARRLNIVQSAVSSSIRALEAELAVPLLVRSTRQVRVTQAGQVLYDRALAVLAAMREAHDAVALVRGLHRGSLAIGTVQSLPSFLDLPSVLARFHGAHPGIEIRLCQGGASHLLDKIRQGQLDLAFLPLCDPPPGISTQRIACEPLALACAVAHPLAVRDEVGLADLSDHAFVDFQPDWGTRRLMDHAFAAQGLERRIAFEVTDLETMLDLVARDLGVAVLPETVARAKGPAVVAVPLAGGRPYWQLVAAFDGARGALPGSVARAFLDLLPLPATGQAA